MYWFTPMRIAVRLCCGVAVWPWINEKMQECKNAKSIIQSQPNLAKLGILCHNEMWNARVNCLIHVTGSKDGWVRGQPKTNGVLFLFLCFVFLCLQRNSIPAFLRARPAVSTWGLRQGNSVKPSICLTGFVTHLKAWKPLSPPIQP